MKSHTEIEFEKSSGNVFADLDLEDADGLFVHAKKGVHIVKLIKSSGLKEMEIPKLLGVAQSGVSSLLDAHFDRFSADELLGFARALERNIIDGKYKEDPFDFGEILEGDIVLVEDFLPSPECFILDKSDAEDVKFTK